jgi:hypothetical protein
MYIVPSIADYTKSYQSVTWKMGWKFEMISFLVQLETQILPAAQVINIENVTCFVVKRHHPL